MTLYPSSLYDRGEELLRALGSFWTDIFGDADKLTQLYRGYMLEAGQTYQDYLEALNCVSRFLIPIYHTEKWYFLTFLRSEVGVTTLRYGDGAVYGPQPTDVLANTGTVFRYGVPYRSSRDFVNAPGSLQRTRLMFNRLLEPSLSYVDGIDFEIDADRQLIYFREDPFSTGLLATRDIIGSDGEIADTEGSLWLHMAEFDRDYLWSQFGYAVGLRLASSEAYKLFINSVWDTDIKAPALKPLQDTLTAISGIPFVKNDAERVTEIIETAAKKQVVTDLEVYTYPVSAEVLVSVGDVVYGGEHLTDVVEILELDGVPDQATLPSVSLGSSFLKGGYQGEVIFDNRLVSLDYGGVDDDNKAIVTFEVSGLDEDVDRFWDTVHAEGKAAGKVLSEWLDRRANPEGPPLPSHLPTTINPLDFVVGQIMSNNLFLIRLKPDKFADGALGLQYMSQLRRIVPPQTTFIVYIETTVDSEYIDPTAPGDDSNAGAEELFDNYMGPDPFDDSMVPVSEASSSEGWVQDFALIIREVSGSC